MKRVYGLTHDRLQKNPGKLMLDNASIAELLIREAEKAEGHREFAFRRAAHSAFMWPVEAADLLKGGLDGS